MDFDTFFTRLIRLTGWGLGIFVIVTGKVDTTQTVALILAFLGFELVARKRGKEVK